MASCPVSLGGDGEAVGLSWAGERVLEVDLNLQANVTVQASCQGVRGGEHVWGWLEL